MRIWRVALALVRKPTVPSPVPASANHAIQASTSRNRAPATSMSVDIPPMRLNATIACLGWAPMNGAPFKTAPPTAPSPAAVRSCPSPSGPQCKTSRARAGRKVEYGITTNPKSVVTASRRNEKRSSLTYKRPSPSDDIHGAPRDALSGAGRRIA